MLQPTVEPGALLAATRRAAKRGVRVRLLLSNAWYVAEENAALVDSLNRWADRAGVPFEARVADPGGAFGKVHAKGVVADDTAVVGSLNWNPTSAGRTGRSSSRWRARASPTTTGRASRPTGAARAADPGAPSRRWWPSRRWARRRGPCCTSGVGSRSTVETGDPARRRGRPWTDRVESGRERSRASGSVVEFDRRRQLPRRVRPPPSSRRARR
ncbi:phospholipase D-like domain-containing protein [Halobaculum litoreum]|uniref:Phospholipase D-like domain-containing protein n=1 Tax=Halobaculum litoreum TaxID=3031998 RepID=A0ABD5XNY8_9EURY